ncbi:hypothetical protein [Halorubrum trueperi]|uniref:Uncharacterized protein n=1 Tax=Halorubrum trueperi TaxID=2004704 RepID=A0ABD5UIX5_9EURY
MSEWFSDEEMDRIARFAESPGYSRDPTMLLPEEDSGSEESDSEEESVEDEAAADATDGAGSSSAPSGGPPAEE